MSADHKELRAAAVVENISLGHVTVQQIHLAELLAAYDALVSASSKPKKASGYTPEFEQMWAEYPKHGNHSKAGAFVQWKKRIKEGDSVESMIEGMRRFALVMAAEARANDKILHAETFFGPTKRYEDEWIVPRAEVRRALPDRRADQQAQANADAIRRLRGAPPDDGMTFDG